MNILKQSLLILFIPFLLYSCSDNESATEMDDDNVSTTELNGIWDLIWVSCECESLDLNDNDHVWRFEEVESQVTIDNSISMDHPAIVSSGTYDIGITEDVITLLSTNYIYRFENDQLILDSGSALDSPLLVFERN